MESLINEIMGTLYKIYPFKSVKTKVLSLERFNVCPRCHNGGTSQTTSQTTTSILI